MESYPEHHSTLSNTLSLKKFQRPLMGDTFWQTVFSKDGGTTISHPTCSLPCINVPPSKRQNLHSMPLNLGFCLLWK